ncbi:MAG TPA: translational GTPase TypA, partial [Elusimicrobiales bacterium]|nr:translational GTPase TypA [Elusimicrobiales bacterium]
MKNRRDDLRNIAIIAHVDHGKTTLVDAILKQTGEFNVKAEEAQDMVLDSNPLERERGITILSKCTSVPYKGNTINIVDTPGHADFGSEVERILQMVDGALMLVDAVDGPMPQTRFVLRKALSLGLVPIVVINKMDNPHANAASAVDKIINLFIDLGATEPQLDFPILYASAKNGWVVANMQEEQKDLQPLFDTIINTVHPPLADESKNLQMLVTMLDYNNFVGQIGIGRIVNGKMQTGQNVLLINSSGAKKQVKITRIEKFLGLRRVETETAKAGDIIAVAGLKDVDVGDTLCCLDNPDILIPLVIDEPTISMEFMVNDSPFAGLEGEFITSRHLKNRLLKEAKTNVGLKIEELPGEGKFKVSGRGELHLAILIETMRREGFEIAVSSPEVILKKENGQILEPTEYLSIDIENEHQGVVFEMLGERGAVMKNMIPEGTQRVRLEYIIPSSSLIGFKSEFLTSTRGVGIMHHSFNGYAPKTTNIKFRKNGVFIVKNAGRTTAYAMYSLQNQGGFFVHPITQVYAGMIVGQNSRDNDLIVNPCKEKNLTNMRKKGSEE